MQRGSTLSAATTAHLERLVLAGLVPGDKLPPERTLAEDLAVSRTTIRAAMQELERRQLVSRAPGRGTVVLPRTAEAAEVLDRFAGTGIPDAGDVAELRAVIEPQIAELAALRGGSSDVVQLEAVLASTHAGISPTESLELDVRFHVQVARASGNPLLLSLCELSSGWVHDVRARSHDTLAGRRSSFEWHRRILECIRQRDGDGARRAMAAHLGDVARLVDETV